MRELTSVPTGSGGMSGTQLKPLIGMVLVAVFWFNSVRDELDLGGTTKGLSLLLETDPVHLKNTITVIAIPALILRIAKVFFG